MATSANIKLTLVNQLFVEKIVSAYILGNMAQESLPGNRKLPDYVGKCT